MKERFKNIFKFGRLKGHGSRGRVQAEHLSGEVHSDLEHPQTFGLEAKPPTGSKTFSLFRGGNPDSGAVLIVAGQAPVEVADGDVCVYNASGMTIEVSGSTIKINGLTNGGLVKINELTAKLNALVASFNSHSHASAGLNDTVAAPFVAAEYESISVKHGGL